jgi:3-oxoacyl-[acyl-carrier protein] reductase
LPSFAGTSSAPEPRYRQAKHEQLWEEPAVLESIEGKVVLVTGAGSGIGLAVARLFASHGARVGANVLPADARGLAALASGPFADRLHPVRADVTDLAELTSAVDAFTASAGPVDVLVSNAGIAQHKSFLELSPSDWQRMLDVHVNGAFNTARLCLPSMIERRSGRIIFTASELAAVGAETLTHYCAAKGALVAFCKALAREVGRYGITVNCVAPGPTETQMLTGYPDEYNERNRETIPLRRWGKPEEIAWTYLFLASDGGSWYTGQFVSPNGGTVM